MFNCELTYLHFTKRLKTTIINLYKFNSNHETLGICEVHTVTSRSTSTNN